jgi:uncharacterized coiled-coil protein SlyX
MLHTTKLEQMLECLLASQEELIAMMKACLEAMEATIKASQGKMEAKIKTGLEEVKATELEANPEVRGSPRRDGGLSGEEGAN